MLLILLLSLDQQRSLRRIVAAGLFNVDVFARLKGSNGQGRVPVVGSRDGNDVPFLLLQNLTKVLFTCRSIPKLMLRHAGKLRTDIAVDVANMRNPRGVLVRH